MKGIINNLTKDQSSFGFGIDRSLIEEYLGNIDDNDKLIMLTNLIEKAREEADEWWLSKWPQLVLF